MHAVYATSLSQKEKRYLWQQLLNEWQQQPQSMKLFCEQQEVKLADLKRWRYRGKVPKAKCRVKPELAPRVEFAVVEIKQIPQESRLLLEHKSDFRLTLTSQTPKAIGLLTSIPC